MRYIAIFIIFFAVIDIQAQTYPLKIALLKYEGGGDWYADPTALPNLINFCNKNLGTNIDSCTTSCSFS